MTSIGRSVRDDRERRDGGMKPPLQEEEFFASTDRERRGSGHRLQKTQAVGRWSSSRRPVPADTSGTPRTRRAPLAEEARGKRNDRERRDGGMKPPLQEERRDAPTQDIPIESGPASALLWTPPDSKDRRQVGVNAKRASFPSQRTLGASGMTEKAKMAAVKAAATKA
jgi:hypothetical protein